MTSPKLHSYHGRVLEQVELVDETYRLRLLAPEIASQARAGHFVQVRVRRDISPLLPRPFSIYQVDREEGWIDILYKVFGPGTEILSRLTPSQTVDVLGPLGRPWKRFSPDLTPVLLGGGVGVVPLYYLGLELADEGREFEAAMGVRSAKEVGMLDDFNSLPGSYTTYTEDGSVGEKGYVTEYLARRMESDGEIAVYACGPTPMLQAVLDLAGNQLVGQVSLEPMMPCGFGICYGCAVYSEKREKYLRSCLHGPMFDLDDIKQL